MSAPRPIQYAAGGTRISYIPLCQCLQLRTTRTPDGTTHHIVSHDKLDAIFPQQRFEAVEVFGRRDIEVVRDDYCTCNRTPIEHVVDAVIVRLAARGIHGDELLDKARTDESSDRGGDVRSRFDGEPQLDAQSVEQCSAAATHGGSSPVGRADGVPEKYSHCPACGAALTEVA